jgi:hypothetical protein
MPLIHRTSVSLRLSGDDLNPEEVTAALGQPPDIGVRSGESWQTPSGAMRRARTGVWRRSVPRRNPGDLDAQIVELLSPLTGDITVWQQLTARFRADVFCGLFLKEANEGCEISSQALFAVGSRGLTLGLDIYAIGRDDD